MKYEYYPNDSKGHASCLRFDRKSGKLSWRADPGQIVLIVQTPFRENAVEKIPGIVEYLNTDGREYTSYFPQFSETIPGIFIRLAQPADLARGGLKYSNFRTYTIFPVALINNEIHIYPPQNAPMAGPTVHIPMEIRISIHKEVKVGWFNKRIETGYYSVHADGSVHDYDDYIDGALFYRVNTDRRYLDIPITAEMLKSGTFYIKSDREPELRAAYDGITICR